MFSKLGRCVTVSNVLLVLVLMLAMTGGAYAASKYVITSTKQISPKVLKSLVGKTGTAGKEGTPGKEGPAGKDGAPGKEGPAGKDGAPGKEGTAGTKGETGPKGAQGEPGEPGPVGPAGPEGTTGFTKTLPPGQTETGTWSGSIKVFQEVKAPEFESFLSPISFTIPLKLAPTQSRIVLNCEDLTETEGHLKMCEEVNKKAEPFCPGTVAIPKAVAGSLCVYQGAKQEPEEIERFSVTAILNPSIRNSEGAGTTGGVVSAVYQGPAGSASTLGTWAVTAPEEAK